MIARPCAAFRWRPLWSHPHHNWRLGNSSISSSFTPQSTGKYMEYGSSTVPSHFPNKRRVTLVTGDAGLSRKKREVDGSGGWITPRCLNPGSSNSVSWICGGILLVLTVSTSPICSNMWCMYLNIRTDHWWPSQTAQVVNSPGESQWPRPFRNFVMTSRNPNDRDFWMSWAALSLFMLARGFTGPIIDSFLTWDSECGNICIIAHGYICWRTVYRLTNVRMSHRWAGWGRVGRGGVGGAGGRNNVQVYIK